MDRVNRRILDWLRRLDRDKLSRSIGVVADDTPFVVTIAGTDYTGLAKLASYTPTIGDRVYVVRSGRDLVVLGKVG